MPKSVAELKRAAQLKRDAKQPINGVGKQPVNSVSELQGHMKRPVMAVTERLQDHQGPQGAHGPAHAKSQPVVIVPLVEDLKDSTVDQNHISEQNLIESSDYYLQNSKSEWDNILDDMDGDDDGADDGLTLPDFASPLNDSFPAVAKSR